MDTRQIQKPGIEEWLHFANVVVERLSDCVRIYKKPPYQDVFISDSERQQKTDVTIRLLHRVHALLDTTDTPSDSVSEAHNHDEQIIDGLIILFAETLRNLPWLSADMQKLMKSPWLSHFPNPAAHKLFAGEGGDETQGIGSGHAEHGRLPAALVNLMEREEMGDTRHPREELLRHGEPRRNDVEGRTRWTSQNGKFLRSAGRVE